MSRKAIFLFIETVTTYLLENMSVKDLIVKFMPHLAGLVFRLIRPIIKKAIRIAAQHKINLKKRLKTMKNHDSKPARKLNLKVTTTFTIRVFWGL
jgi:hypothetical protein